jgi:hypothetical protein
MKKQHREKFSTPVGNYPPAGCQGPVVGVYDEQELKSPVGFLARICKKFWSKPKPLPPKAEETESLKGFGVFCVDLVNVDGEDFVVAIITDGKTWINACYPRYAIFIVDEHQL